MVSGFKVQACEDPVQTIRVGIGVSACNWRLAAFLSRNFGEVTRTWKPCYLLRAHMGGCQNDGPFWDPYYNTAPNI